MLQPNVPSTIFPHHITSKLVLLTRAFPNLRIIWSSSPSETAQIFKELKEGNPEPVDKEGMSAILFLGFGESHTCFVEGNEQMLLEEEKDMDAIFDPLDIVRKCGS